MKEAGARLKNAPEGTLRLSGCRKSIQYYRCLPGGRKNGEYLPKSREKLIRALAQKSYDEKVVRLAEKKDWRRSGISWRIMKTMNLKNCSWRSIRKGKS